MKFDNSNRGALFREEKKRDRRATRTIAGTINVKCPPTFAAQGLDQDRNEDRQETSEP